MREITLKQFFLGEISAETLAVDVSGSVIRLDRAVTTVQIEDMKEQFCLWREHLISLCDASLEKTLPSESLSAIAFALMASDAFEWDDEVISEVLSDWSCPEINYPLNAATLNTHRDWLCGISSPPVRPTSLQNFRPGRLISKVIKVQTPSGS